MVRSAVAAAVRLLHGAGVLETETTTDAVVVALKPNEGDPCYYLTVTSRDNISSMLLLIPACDLLIPLSYHHIFPGSWLCFSSLLISSVCNLSFC